MVKKTLLLTLVIDTVQNFFIFLPSGIQSQDRRPWAHLLDNFKATLESLTLQVRAVELRMEPEGRVDGGMETASPSLTPQLPSWLNATWEIRVQHSLPNRKGNLKTRLRQDCGAL